MHVQVELVLKRMPAARIWTPEWKFVTGGISIRHKLTTGCHALKFQTYTKNVSTKSEDQKLKAGSFMLVAPALKHEGE